MDESSLEHKFVKYADKICAYIKCVDEVNQGNAEFAKAKETILAEITAYNAPEVDYFMTNFLPAFTLTLDELDV